MDRTEVIRELKGHIVREILEGDDAGFDEQSPLLEWGVLNSLEIVRLLTFIRQSWEVDMSRAAVTPESFKDLGSIADLVVDTAAERDKRRCES